MFEEHYPGSPVVDAKRIDGLVVELRSAGEGLDDTGRIDAIRSLEALKAAAAAAQARIASGLERSRREDLAEKGMPASRQGQGIGAEVALARRESPNRGGRHLGFAIAVVREMPHTLALLEQGLLSEWRATILVRETACLTREDRATVDRQLCADPATSDGMGDRTFEAKARALAARLDPEAMVRRARKAVGDRRVTSRPAPDTMAYVTALLPVKEGVAVHATLGRDADSILATGDADGRTRSQLMADLLVERVTGVSTAAAQPITVNIVVSDEVLFGNGAAPAHVDGYGDIPAGLARRSIVDASSDTDTTMLRRVYAHPGTGALTAMESKSRCFPAGLARFIDIRDRTCRTPWCDAPIRHRDHVESHEDGGETAADNGAGLCEACNYAKQAPGWNSEPKPRPRMELHTYEFSTPTGHRYQSTSPPLPIPAPNLGVALHRLALLHLRGYVEVA